MSSCLYDYMKEHNQKGIKTFNFWSYNCGGQNRNPIVFAAYLRAAKDFAVTITHKYLLPGCNWTINTKRERVFWSQLRQLEIWPQFSDRIQYKQIFVTMSLNALL